MTRQASTFAFGGGLDTNSAALAIPPGCVIASQNYEPLAEGYGRIEGYERYDGRPAPSDASYWTIPFASGSATFVVGDTVTGGTSGAYGAVIAAPLDVTGDWGAGTAAGTLLLTNVTGTFQGGEALKVAGVTRATSTGTATEKSGTDLAARYARLTLAQSYRRSLIGAVPGSGPVRGVAVHAGTIYAWRDNIGATACVGYKATTSGWTALPVHRRMTFTLGTSEVFEGDTLTGATSGATGYVRRVVVTSGDWATANAAGYIDLSAVTGIFTAEIVKVGATNCATGAATSAITLPPGGRYRTISHNFYGNKQRYRLYGVNGVGPAFEIMEDGGIGTIPSGMGTDTPNRIFEISNHLGLVFPGGSVQFSGTGEPRQWEPITGAGEFGLGTECTDVIQSNETAVVLFGETKVCVLQGHDASDFVLDTLTEEAGAEPDSAQRMGNTVYLDRRGLRSLSATQAFGNFKTGTLSGRFERYFRDRQRGGARVIGSFVSKSKSHYRLMYDDGSGLSVYMGGKAPEAMVFRYDTLRPSCFAEGEIADGEAILVGAEDGFVYRLDRGNTFDGASFYFFAQMAYNHFGNPTQEDRFFEVILELVAPSLLQVGIAADFDYSDGEKVRSINEIVTLYGAGALWNAGIWNNFVWSSAVEGRAKSSIDGLGRNASFIFLGASQPAEDRHILQAYIVHRSPRRFVR